MEVYFHVIGKEKVAGTFCRFVHTKCVRKFHKFHQAPEKSLKTLSSDRFLFIPLVRKGSLTLTKVAKHTAAVIEQMRLPAFSESLILTAWGGGHGVTCSATWRLHTGTK